MKLIENTDPYSKSYVSKGWASTGFEPLDDYDAAYESTESFGILNSTCTNFTDGSTCQRAFSYSINGTFSELGGFVRSITIDD